MIFGQNKNDKNNQNNEYFSNYDKINSLEAIKGPLFLDFLRGIVQNLGEEYAWAYDPGRAPNFSTDSLLKKDIFSTGGNGGGDAEEKNSIARNQTSPTSFDMAQTPVSAISSQPLSPTTTLSVSSIPSSQATPPSHTENTTLLSVSDASKNAQRLARIALQTGNDWFLDFFYYLLNTQPLYDEKLEAFWSPHESNVTLRQFKSVLCLSFKAVIEDIRYGFAGGYIFHQVIKKPESLKEYLGSLIFIEEENNLFYVAYDKKMVNNAVLFPLWSPHEEHPNLSAIKIEPLRNVKEGSSWMFLGAKQACELTGNPRFTNSSDLLTVSDFEAEPIDVKLGRSLKGLRLGDTPVDFYTALSQVIPHSAEEIKLKTVDALRRQSYCALAFFKPEDLVLLKKMLSNYLQDNPDMPMPVLQWLSDELNKKGQKPEKIEFSEQMIADLGAFFDSEEKNSLQQRLNEAKLEQSRIEAISIRILTDNFSDEMTQKMTKELFKVTVIQVNEQGKIIDIAYNKDIAYDKKASFDTNATQIVFILKNNEAYFPLFVKNGYHAQEILGNYFRQKLFSFPFPWWSDEIYQAILMERFKPLRSSILNSFKQEQFGRALLHYGNEDIFKKFECIFLEFIIYYLPENDEQFLNSYWSMPAEKRKQLPETLKELLLLAEQASAFSNGHYAHLHEQFTTENYCVTISFADDDN